jgi:hypothetical protein
VESRVSSYLDKRTQGSNRSKLLENIGVPQHNASVNTGFVLGLVGANGFRDRLQLLSRKSPLRSRVPCFWQWCTAHDPIWPVARDRRADGPKNSQIVHPRRRKQHVVVALLAFGDLAGQCIESRLMAKFVGRLRLCANIRNDRIPPR